MCADTNIRAQSLYTATTPPPARVHTIVGGERKECTVPRLIPVFGQQIRVNVRDGTGVPLVLCNGMGTSLEVLDPLVAELNPNSPVVRFDVPGTGGSPDSLVP